MAIGRIPSRGSDQFVVRFPEGMRDRVREAAEANGRSMNTEIITRLEASFANSSWPIIGIDDERLMQRIWASSPKKRETIEARLNEFVYRFLLREFTPQRAVIELFHDHFETLLESAQEHEKPRLRKQFRKLVLDMTDGDEGWTVPSELDAEDEEPEAARQEVHPLNAIRPSPPTPSGPSPILPPADKAQRKK